MENRLFWIVVLAVLAVVAVILLQTEVEDRILPEPESAWVAVEIAETGVAVVGPVEIGAGVPFTLHAVLGARGRTGGEVFYTDAPGLRFGDREIPAESLRPWRRSRPVKVRWYTVEGRWPYLPLGSEGIQTFGLQEFLRSDWPLTWSVPGMIDVAHDDHLERVDALPSQIFGTQRYQVRIELYGQEDDLVPLQTIRSWGVADLKQNVDAFPTVSMVAYGAAAPASRVFGLTQLDPPEEADADLVAQIDELAQNRIAFSSLTVLRDQLEGAGKRWQELEWRPLDLAGTAGWGGDADTGDLLRVGDRVVVLYEDRGDPEILDYQDLCFDFVQGATVRPLGDVFGGDGQVELASLR